MLGRSKMQIVYNYLAVLFALGTTCQVLAANTSELANESDKADTLDPYIEQISVTASPFRTRIIDSASAVEVLAGDEKKRYQSLSLGVSLEKMAGVSNVATGGQSGKPVIRGLSGDRIRILLDGVPQDHQQYGVRHPPNVDPFLADQIEVVKGPMSVLYGADAMGGVVNLISRPLLVNSGVTGLNSATLFSQYHSNNSQRSLYFDADGAYKNWGGYLGGGKTLAGNFHAPDIQTYPLNSRGNAPLFAGVIPFTDFEAQDLAAAVGYANNQFETTLRYAFWSNDQNYLQQNGQASGQFLTNHNVLLDSIYQLNLDWLLKSRLSWQQNLRDAGTGVAYQDLNQSNIDLSLELNRYQGRFSLVHDSIAGWQGELGLDLVTKQQRTHIGSLLPDADTKSLALFAFERLEAENWITEIGVRFDHISQQADVTAQQRDQRSWNALSGSLGLTWRFTEHWLASTHLARGFRAPSVFDLYAQGVHGGVMAYQQGNPLLNEEYSLNKDIGIRYFTHKLNLSVTVFHNNIADYIYQARTGENHPPTGLPIHQLKQGDAELKGAEFDVTWQLVPSVKLSANYTLINSELKDVGAELPLLPADQMHTEILWQSGNFFGLTATEFYLNMQHFAKKQSAGAYEPFSQYDRLPFGTASTRAYQLWHVGMAGELSIGTTPVSISLAVKNVFDKAYSNFLDTYKGYAPGMGRSVNVSFSIPIGTTKPNF